MSPGGTWIAQCWRRLPLFWSRLRMARAAGESLGTTVLWDHREEFTATASASDVEGSIAEAALKLTSRVNVDDVCDAVLIGVERVFSPRMTWIALHDEAADMLQVRLCRGRGAEMLRNTQVPPGKGLTGQAFS